MTESEFANTTDDQLDQMIADLESTLSGWNDIINDAGPFESEWDQQDYLNRQDYAQDDLKKRLADLKQEKRRRTGQG